MSILTAHLEQINYSCQGIDSLPFPSPRIFTNALLSNDDITSLIRDTEPHERALFSVPPPPPPPQQSTTSSSSLAPGAHAPKGSWHGGSDNSGGANKAGNRRQTVFNVASGEVTTGPPTTRGPSRRHTAVAAVLGGEMHEELRRGEAGRKGGDVDVEVLLRGAEKLCGVYELPGARERIATLRAKYKSRKGTMAYYEAKVAEQAETLAGMDRRDWLQDDDDEEEDEQEERSAEQGKGRVGVEEDGLRTVEDLRREEEGVREMEKKKRELQTRLRQMEKDLGGLMNM